MNPTSRNAFSQITPKVTVPIQHHEAVRSLHDEFQLPAIGDCPNICLIIEIARYMPSKECRRVFTEILPAEKFKSVYDLVMAERVSNAVRRSIDWERTHNAEDRIYHSHIFVDNVQDMSKLFPGGDVGVFVESIIPNYQLLEKKDWDGFAMGRLQEVWTKFDPLYSIHGNITSKMLLNVSEKGEELWHQWQVNGNWINSKPNLFQEFCSLAGMRTHEASILVDLVEPTLHLSRSGIWLSQDRKVLLTRTRVNNLLDNVYLTCVGVRSRSKYLFHWLLNSMGHEKKTCNFYENYDNVYH